jgi:hypothetical protein
MTKVLAAITTSVDGYVARPDDGPRKGLGEGGERLHYFTDSLELEHIDVRQSPFATFIDSRVKR